jgi:hypothetical protein
VRLAAAIAALVLAAFASGAEAQDPAMRLEMLAERIAKLHAQVGQGVLAERSRRALAEAIRDFDAGLKEVKARPAGPEIRDNYVLLGLLWSEYRAWATKPATRDNAKKLAERAEEVAWIAAKGARLVHEPGRRGTGKLALDAAHAAMLSQRLARLYLTQRWDVKQESAGRAIPGVSADLQATLERLRSAPQNTPEIVIELQAAEGQMGFLVQGGRELLGKRAGAQAPEFVAKSADHLLESMERVVRLYEGGA